MSMLADNTGKFVIAVIVLVIWGINALITAINKRQKQARQQSLMHRAPVSQPAPTPRPGVDIERQFQARREAAERHRQQVREQLERARALAQGRLHGPAAIPRVAPPRIPAPVFRAPPSPPRRAVAKKPAPVIAAAAPPPLVSTQPVAAAAAPQSAVRATPSASSTLLHRWMTPRTLRSQFILTEIFQPPLAMREPRE